MGKFQFTDIHDWILLKMTDSKQPGEYPKPKTLDSIIESLKTNPLFVGDLKKQVFKERISCLTDRFENGAMDPRSGLTPQQKADMDIILRSFSNSRKRRREEQEKRRISNQPEATGSRTVSSSPEDPVGSNTSGVSGAIHDPGLVQPVANPPQPSTSRASPTRYRENSVHEDDIANKRMKLMEEDITLRKEDIAIRKKDLALREEQFDFIKKGMTGTNSEVASRRLLKEMFY